MAASDLHFGYEVSRRIAGGLWPLWGMRTIRERLTSLIEDWSPERLILVGDVVDSAAAPRESIEWLESIAGLGPDLVLVAGNHDRGAVRRHFPFVDSHREGEFFFHHGHEERPLPEASRFEVTGHLHPSVRFQDGAGTSLKLPTFTREKDPVQDREIWVLPAFSPWAGGHSAAPRDASHEYHRWVCGGHRIFEVSG